jgi:hypothetical protein
MPLVACRIACRIATLCLEPLAGYFGLESLWLRLPLVACGTFTTSPRVWLDASRRLQDRLQDSYSLPRASCGILRISLPWHVSTNYSNSTSNNSTSTDLFASSIWKDGPFAVRSICRQTSRAGTDLFASSLLQTASTSRHLRDVMDDTKITTHDSVNNVLAYEGFLTRVLAVLRPSSLVLDHSLDRKPFSRESRNMSTGSL